MPSALDPLRDIMPEARRQAAVWAAKRAARPSNSDRSTRAAQTRRHDIRHDPIMSEMVDF